MTKIESFIKSGDEFEPIEQFAGKIGDPQYIEGAIELSIGGKLVLDKSMWDYVDQLWAYLVEGLVSVCRDGKFFTYFPDQPIKLSFWRDSAGKKLAVEVEFDSKSLKTQTNFKEFATSMTNAANTFFTKLIDLVPANRKSYEAIIQKLLILRKWTEKEG